MDDWYELLEDEQEAEHDRVCNEGAECRRRDEHIQGTYIPIALKQQIERMKKDRATVIAAAEKRGAERGWDEGLQAGWEECRDPGPFMNDYWDSKVPNPYRDGSAGAAHPEGQ